MISTAGAIHKALIVAIIAGALGLSTPGLAGEESCRIRIQNTVGGLVQVSTDGGRTYGTVGRVTTPANARILGFAASSYAPAGTVAATAVHGLRIKTGQYAIGVGKAQKPMMFSVCPLEFATIPQGYGGHRPRSSGIHTDIYAGHSIFRNEAPYADNPVFLERNRMLEPLPEDYTPAEGDTFVILVKRPDNPPREVVFENQAKGKVTAINSDGTSELIAEVVRPVRGTGRYDGTSFTGVGSINTNHGGVITISTAPVMPPKTVEGGSVETRGGFMIQPYYHVTEQGETSPQVMVVGPVNGSKKPNLEGTPPLFRGNINLSRYPEHPANSMRAEVRIDDGDWQSVPQVVGKMDDALTPTGLQRILGRSVRQGVTAVRLLFPEYDPKRLEADLAREVDDYTRRAAGSMKTVKGTVGLAPTKPSRLECMVNFYVDGVPIETSNRYPFSCEWDSTRVPNGLHYVEIETVFQSGAEPVVESRRVLVHN